MIREPSGRRASTRGVIRSSRLPSTFSSSRSRKARSWRSSAKAIWVTRSIRSPVSRKIRRGPLIIHSCASSSASICSAIAPSPISSSRNSRRKTSSVSSASSSPSRGGDGPGGFDCSGLVQAAYAAAGIQLPRTAQEQFDAGQLVADGQQLEPGDLVFFGTGASDVTHVGIMVSQTEMVNAPHTGAVVRLEPYDWSDYLGATRPTGS